MFSEWNGLAKGEPQRAFLRVGKEVSDRRTAPEIFPSPAGLSHDAMSSSNALHSPQLSDLPNAYTRGGSEFLSPNSMDLRPSNRTPSSSPPSSARPAPFSIRQNLGSPDHRSKDLPSKSDVNPASSAAGITTDNAIVVFTMFGLVYRIESNPTTALDATLFVTSVYASVLFRQLALVTRFRRRFDTADSAMKVVYHQVTQPQQQSFRVLEVRGSNHAGSWHFHREYPIGLVLDGSGHRIVGANKAGEVQASIVYSKEDALGADSICPEAAATRRLKNSNPTHYRRQLQMMN